MLGELDIRSWLYIPVDNVVELHCSSVSTNKLDYRQSLYNQHLDRMVMEYMDLLVLSVLQ